MIENLTISISFSEVEEAHVGNYFHLSEMSGEFLIIQKPDNTFYFLCSNDCDIVGICQSFKWNPDKSKKQEQSQQTTVRQDGAKPANTVSRNRPVQKADKKGVSI